MAQRMSSPRCLSLFKLAFLGGFGSFFCVFVMMREILTIWRLRELELEDGKADGQSGLAILCTC